MNVSTTQTSGFGALLKRYRDVAGLTQEELAERAGLSVEAISGIERGLVHVPRKDTVARLADALGLTETERESFSETARAHPRSRLVGPQNEEPATAAPVLVVSGNAQMPHPAPAGTRGLIPKRRTAWRYALLILVLMVFGTAAYSYKEVRSATNVTQPPGGVFTPWGWAHGSPLQFSNPRHLAVDHRGNLYVVDEWKRTIFELSSSGEWLHTWDSAAFGRGMDTVPTGVTVDAGGTMYVSDITNFRVLSISPNARVRPLWTIGDFNWDHLDVAVDGHGNIYTVDTSHGISRFSKSSGLIDRWGTYGQSCTAGSLSEPYALTVDGRGAIYVTDWGNDCLQKVSPARHTFSVLGSPGSGPGQFRQPMEVSLDQHGNVYVADSGNNRIQKLSPDGKFLAAFGTRGPGPGQFLTPQGVAVDGAGNIYESDLGSGRVQKLSPHGQAIPGWRPWIRALARFDRPCCLTVDRSGIVFVAGSGAGHQIQRVGPDGQLLAPLRLHGFPASQVSDITGMAADASDNLYVADGVNDCLYRFSFSGKLLAQWGGPKQLSGPSGVAVDSVGNVYVADTGGFVVRKFSPSGTPDAGWSLSRLKDRPNGVAIDSHGYVYVTVVNAHVARLAPSGQILTEWTPRQSRTGQSFHPAGVSVDRRGVVYVSDPDANRVQALSPEGTLLATWGAPGTGSGRFDGPNGVAISASGDVYIADTLDNSIQKLSARA